MQVNNRKLSQGFFRSLGLTDLAGVLRIVDKLDKIGPDRVADALRTELGAGDAQAKAVLRFASISSLDESFAEQVQALGGADPLLDEGLAELVQVVSTAREHAPGFLVADLRIARGLDYYTGTVYETVLVGHEGLGSVCSGGRYDSLASDGATTYPGVGISFGVTRTLGPLFSRGALRASRSVLSCVLVALVSEDRRTAAAGVAATLRRRGICAEVAPSADKFGKQIRYADRRGIPFVWFPEAGQGQDEVKDIRSGDQGPADPTSWLPAPEDLVPQLVCGR
jgi:histidyl-tRNA synthetase